MNKEDIWVSEIPIPVTDKVTSDVQENFASMPEKTALQYWNIYSPLWASVGIAALPDGKHALRLQDEDPFDFAKAERIIPASTKSEISFAVMAAQNNHGTLEIDLTDEKGTPCIRLIFDSTGTIATKAGYRNKSVGKYTVGESIDFKIEFDAESRFYKLSVNGKILPIIYSLRRFIRFNA